MLFYAHPCCWGSVGLRVRVPHGQKPYALIPTKTSRLYIHLFGRSPSFSKTCFQVSPTIFIVLVSHFILVAIILSSVSLRLIAFLHAAEISAGVCSFSCITLSH